MASVISQIRALQRMSLPQLQQKWLEVFGEETKQRDRDQMWRRLALKLQEDLLAGLSPEDRATVERYREEFRRTPPDKWFPGARHNRKRKARPSPSRDHRLPGPGSAIRRVYKGNEVVVKVLDRGFEYQGSVFKSLSAVAYEVTGTRWNGFTFFGLSGSGRR